MIHIKYCKNCKEAFDIGTNFDICANCRNAYRTHRIKIQKEVGADGLILEKFQPLFRNLKPSVLNLK